MTLTATLPDPFELPQSLPLRKAARELIDASVSPNTLNAYQRALKQFGDWMAEAGVGKVTDSCIANYLVHLYEVGKSPATCGQVVAALRFYGKLQGLENPVGPETYHVLRGIRREGRARGRGQVKGVGFAEAELASKTAEKGETLRDLRDAALLAVMSDGLLRISEARALAVDDVTFEEDGTGRLLIRASKTDQEGEGAVLFLGSPTVQRIRRWLAAAEVADGPLFRRVWQGDDRVGEAPMNVDSLREIIKQRCEAIGIEGVSGHSLRIGGAQSLAEAGATLVEMQNAGRWISPSMPGHYTRGQLAGRGAVARIKYGQQRPEA